MASLWGEEFEIPKTRQKTLDIKKKLEEKTPEQLLKSRTTPLRDKIEIITQKVHEVLGHYESIIRTIKSVEDLHDYITKCIENEVVAIDTETNNSLDPITCKIMGLCLYTPGEKAAYVPVNHINIDTGEKLSWQITERQIHDELLRIVKAKTKIIMHNGQFDYRVIKCTCDVDLDIYWDTYGGARMIDENELSAGLKQQYISKIDPSQERYSIEYLFNGLPYEIFDPELFAYYSATDSYLTYELYKWQVERFKDPLLSGNYRLFREVEVPLEPVLARMTLRGMALDNGYSERLSKKYHKLVEESDIKIEKELEKYKDQILQWRLTPEANYKKPKGDGTYNKSKSEQLSDPVNIESPTQLAILLYDIFKVPQVSDHSPRGVGIEELKKIEKATKQVNSDFNLCTLILEKRNLDKLLSTFVDKMPQVANERDHKVHPSFNNYGTDTGRMASSDPNLQNVPSINHEIRAMFCAQRGEEKEVEFIDSIDLEPYDKVITGSDQWSKVRDLKVGDIIYSTLDLTIAFKISRIIYQPNYVDYEIHLTPENPDLLGILTPKITCYKTEKILIGSDYSQLEVKTTVHTCKDPEGIKAYKEGKDFYSIVAAMSFGKTYEECLEFYPEGTVLQTPTGPITCGKKEVTNYEGKILREQAKSILIGSIYQRGAASIAEQINENVDNPAERKSRDDVQKMMDDFYKGFPAMSKWMEDSKKFVREHGYITNAVGRRRLLPAGMLPMYEVEISSLPSSSKFNPLLNCENKVDNTLVEKYNEKLKGVKYKSDFKKIQDEALLEGVTIKDNSGLIAQAERRAVNCQCQSLGADIVKKLMLVIDKDEVLKDLGFYLLLQIHDEIIGECPIETQEQVIERINYLMSKVPEDMGILVPFTTDAYAVTNWYIDGLESTLLKTYSKLTEKEHLSKEEALNKIYEEHEELTRDAIDDYLLHNKPLTTN